MLNSFLKLWQRLLPPPASFSPPPAPAHPTVQGHYTLPANSAELPAGLQPLFAAPYRLAPVHVFSLHDVYFTAVGVVFKNLHVFGPSLPDQRVAGLLNRSFLLKQFARLPGVHHTTQPRLVLAHDQWSQNYYHWMIDLLPRLLLLPAELRQLPLVLPSFEAGHLLPTLRALGFDNFYRLRDNEIVFAKELLLPERTAVGAFQNPELLRRVQQQLVQALCPAAGPPTRRIYASRARATKRRLLNEPALEELLRGLGFEIIAFEDMDFAAQVQLMRETQLFVGVHGANLVNILFMQPGSAVVEIMNTQLINLVYYRMASALELPYYFVPAESTRAPAAADPTGYDADQNDADVRVDVGTVAALLHRLLSAAS